MRLVKITQYYEKYVESSARRFPAASALPYAEQSAALLSDCFDWGCFWRQELALFGYEMVVLVANHKSLQRAWAREHGVEIDEQKWKEQIVIEQLKSLKPEIVWMDDLHVFGGAFIRELKSLFPNVKLWMAWSGSPLPRDADVTACDLILSNLPGQIAQFRAQGVSAHYLAHAFSPQVLERLGPAIGPESPFTFVGSIFSGPDGHNSRLELLAYLAEKSPLQIHSILARGLASKPMKNRFYHHLFQTFSLFCRPDQMPGKWQVRHGAHLLRNRILDPVFGLEMFRILRGSKVSLNQHIDISKQGASNMRLFEATGVASCLLTDWKNNLGDFFEPEREVVSYQSPQECLEKYQWLSEHPSEREAIARAGQRRTLKDHTFEKRAVLVDEILKKHL